MVSAFTIIILCLIIIPTVPLVLYCIGLLLPSSHIVSRTLKYNTTPEIMWAILTSVRDYPAWRSNIEKVTIQSDELENELNRVTFVEYSKKDRRTVVIHIEQEHEKKLLRVLEERPHITPDANIPTRIPTFSGSWTFTIDLVEGEKAVTLKITEQGVIKKPMVRVSHMLFFGYHRRIDRFMKDLGKEIELGVLNVANEKKREIETIEEEEEYEAGPDDSILYTAKVSTMTDSKFLDKEWDMMNDSN